MNSAFLLACWLSSAVNLISANPRPPVVYRPIDITGEGEGVQVNIQARTTRVDNACNSQPVMVTDSSAALAPNPWGYGYTAGVCIWALQAPEGQTIEFVFKGIFISCRYGDYVYIEDQNGRVIFPASCGWGKPTPMMSFTNVAYVIFRSRWGDRTRYGFELTYTMTGSPSPVVPGIDPCIAPGVLLDNENGRGQSKNFPADYEDRSDCRWQISTAPETVILVEFEAFAVENHARCLYDRLIAYDSADASGEVITTLCGSQKPFHVKSSSHNMFLQFLSDESVTAAGFKFSYRSIPFGTPNDGSAPGCSVDNNLSGSAGSVTSPNYGSTSTYPARSGCAHKITVAQGKTIRLEFTDFDLEDGGASCIYDRVTIYDGPDSLTSMLTLPLCGSDTPVVPESSSNSVYVVFESDASVERAGFSLSWRETVNTNPCSGGVFLNQASGDIFSPGFGTSGYGNRQLCKWHISTPSGSGRLSLQWKNFNVEYDRRCRYDYVEVFEGPDESFKSLGRRCGNGRPADMISTRGSFTLVLKTDSSVTRNGFHVYFETTDEISSSTTAPVSTSTTSPSSTPPLISSTTATPPAPVSTLAPGVCGVPSFGPYAPGATSDATQYIVGGTEAVPHSIPWQVMLMTVSGSRRVFRCGGTIIAPGWILSAAHCTTGDDATSFEVVAGDHNWREAGNDQEQIKAVVEKYEHPNYNPDTLHNDAVLLKLSEEFTYNQFVKPACLKQEPLSVRSECFISGWGRTSASSRTSSTLQVVTVPIRTTCSRIYSGYDSAIMVCAGGNGVDACFGDSGGPLVCRDQVSRAWNLHGVTSFGDGCAVRAGVWAKVSAYESWIERITGGDATFA